MINARIGELRADLNGRLMKRYGKSRRELFTAMERGALRPLPAERFEFAAWEKPRVNIDYHVLVDHHFYSVPYRLAHMQVDARLTADLCGALPRACARRLASPLVRARRLHDAARSHAELAPGSGRVNAVADPGLGRKLGPATRALCEAILSDRPHPEQGFRSCLGILRLARRHADARTEAACARAAIVRARSYRHVESILKHGHDRVDSSPAAGSPTPRPHENVRGRDYYY